MIRTISIATIFSLILISCSGGDDSVDLGDPVPPTPPVPTEINFLSFLASPNILNEINLDGVIENIGDAKTTVSLNWIVRDANEVILDNFTWLLSSMAPGDVLQITAFSSANYFQADSIEYWVTWDDGTCFDCGESLHYKISK